MSEALPSDDLRKWCEGIPPHRQGCDCAYCRAAVEIERLNGIYIAAVNGRREFRDELRKTRERASFSKLRSDPTTWVLHLLANDEISVGKAAEWLREYICHDKQGTLPKVESLP